MSKENSSPSLEKKLSPETALQDAQEEYPFTKLFGDLQDSDIEALFNSISTFVFDCDGVVYSGGTFFPYTLPFLKFLRENGKRIIFFTNSKLCGH